MVLFTQPLRVPKQKGSVASLNTREYDELIALLIEVRKDKKVGQERLSEMVGQGRNYVQKIEYKHRRIDVVEFLFLARALETDPAELFSRFLARLA